MRGRVVRCLVAVSALLTASVSASAGSAAPVTWTQITTPSATSVIATKPTVTIAGVTSSDVTSVDIDCVYDNAASGEQQVVTLASDVAVTSGAFTAKLSVLQVSGVCRLRAVPAGTTTTYYASFSGPVLYVKIFLRSGGAGDPGWDAVQSRGDAFAVAADTGTCPDSQVGNVQGPSLSNFGIPGCSFSLEPENRGSDEATGSSITVDGNNAYLPSGVSAFLENDLSLPVTPVPPTTKASTAHNGDLIVTESAVLQRCSAANTYPPTLQSCPGLVSTGVTFTRVTSFVHDSQQVQIRDSFTSTGKAHTVRLQYQNGFLGLPAGAGFAFPAEPGTFSAPPGGKAVTGLGSRAATVLVRSDRYAGATDPQADTHAYTWSKAPSKLQFETSQPNLWAMYYSLALPARGTAQLGFAVSERPTTAAVTRLAADAVAAVITAPTISSPHTGATIKGKRTVVTGAVTAGANGLPPSVSVNGHKAALTMTSASKATWKVSFSEGYGSHLLEAVATDDAGNSANTQVSVRNTKS